MFGVVVEIDTGAVTMGDAVGALLDTGKLVAGEAVVTFDGAASAVVGIIGQVDAAAPTALIARSALHAALTVVAHGEAEVRGVAFIAATSTIIDVTLEWGLVDAFAVAQGQAVTAFEVAASVVADRYASRGSLLAYRGAITAVIGIAFGVHTRPGFLAIFFGIYALFRTCVGVAFGVCIGGTGIGFGIGIRGLRVLSCIGACVQAPVGIGVGTDVIDSSVVGEFVFVGDAIGAKGRLVDITGRQ